MLRPKKTKFRKYQKQSLKKSRKNVLFLDTLKEGIVRLDSLQSARITAKQLESSRQSISRRIKKLGKLQLKAFPDFPVSNKPTEVRMGKGKGAVEYWACKVKPGTTIFEISGADRVVAIKALESGASKLPVLVKIVG
ncbi:50S ribosomal protein L16 (mitochondrion) [Aureococcus anophagefferens]|jgi:large subunit ribosomal protein L16|uniref:Ribosomal protein L16 n=1 Tax=Aureococcus anophagefferens TaxID=44056 RepID=A0A649UBV9_AURAN|nr:50S ribosomal protein L16 [Aureococcus anophagefferens]MDA9172976.1 50S ribosomal protein L16 [bacterium]KAH8042919.1 50S ribosomal protein L16 [Aureococcus anophagefferens]KAH8043159.1 50S ribosomal protein L16 [Aureococcus anophagefferens]QGI24632.1 ribosomal protein L16 [Aureococcus anophagefferens]